MLSCAGLVKNETLARDEIYVSTHLDVLHLIDVQFLGCAHGIHTMALVYLQLNSMN